MPRFEDFRSDPEVRDIVERFLKRFPRVFAGFSVADVGFVVTEKKKGPAKHPVKVRAVSYPNFVFAGVTYIFETFDKKWKELNKKQRNIAVFHAMCSIPIGGFDPASKVYGKILKPDFELYRQEYAATGGVADWFEDERARDPMEIDADEVLVPGEEEEEDPIPDEGGGKHPVTAGDIAEVGSEEESEPEAVAS